MTALKQKRTFLDLFPAPQFLLLSTSGVAITDTYIKFVELKKETFGDGLKLVHAEKVDIPQGVVESGVIQNPDKLIALLKDLSHRFGIHYTYATLPEEKSYLFTTTIDWVSLENLKDAVAFVIEENAPVSLAESVFDFEVVKGSEQSGKVKVAVSVLPREIVNNYAKIFKSAGVMPISFNLESRSLARALIHSGDRRPHLIVNLSLEKTGFYVVEEEVVQFSTTSNYGIGEDDSYPTLNDLKAELRKVLTFRSTRTDSAGKPEKNIEKIILCGKGARKTDFVEKLMEESEIDYRIADVWLNTSPSNNTSKKVSFDESISYAAPIGLILFNEKE